MELKLPVEFTGEGMYVNAYAGIYAIVNPVGEIYIGYSKQLRDRVKKHKTWVAPELTLLAKSMFKHGRKNHKFYLVKELDENDSVGVFAEMEKFYIEKYRSEGYALLNSNNGGSVSEKGKSRIKRGDLYPLVYENSWRPPSQR
jgi:hypothetical protein